MEIERKWMVAGWPEPAGVMLRHLGTEYQEQGYVHAEAPIVRIRLEARIEGAPDVEAGAAGSVTLAAKELVSDENAQYVLCFKSAGFLSREEIEIKIGREHFTQLSELAGHALIRKVRRIYSLPDGLELEVNLVDEGLPTQFMYAEVEFQNEEQARSFHPAVPGLRDYLNDDVTEQPGQSMSAFWIRTRMNRKENS